MNFRIPLTPLRSWRLCVIFFFLSFSSYSQMQSIFSNDFVDTSSSKVGVAGSYDINANALSSNFISKFFKGGYIDSDLKGQVLDRTRQKNRIGVNLDLGLFAAVKFDSSFLKHKVWFFLDVRDREHFDLSYSRDFFKVGFYGNADYAGKTASFNGLSLNFMRYQQLQFGFFATSADTTSRWGVGISILKGEQYASLFAETAELFTSEDGQYIDFKTNLTAAQSDTARSGLSAFNGIGASADIYFSAPMFSKAKRKTNINVSISDIGAIRFNKQSLYMKQDTTFHYSGFNINSVYDLQDSAFGHNATDSIVKSIAPFKKQAINITLPTTLNLSFETHFNKYFTLTEGISYSYNSNSKLNVYVKANFYLSPRVLLLASLGYGGYGRENYGLGIKLNLRKNMLITACCTNFAGLVSPRTNSGQGAAISIIKKFK